MKDGQGMGTTDGPEVKDEVKLSRILDTLNAAKKVNDAFYTAVWAAVDEQDKMEIKWGNWTYRAAR